MVLGIVPEPRRVSDLSRTPFDSSLLNEVHYQDAFSVFIIIRDRPDMDTVTALQELIEGATAVGYEDVQRIEVDSCAGTSMRVVLHSAAAGWALLGALKWRLEDGSRDIQAFRVSNIINS